MPPKPAPATDHATLAQRLVAHALDLVVAFALVLVGFMLAETLELVSGTAATACRYLGATLGVGYRLLADGLMGGRSAGKRLTRIHVVQASTGRSCGVARSFFRSLPLFLPFVNLLDVFLLLQNKRERLGDRLAGTWVLQRSLSKRRTRSTRP